MFSLTNKSTKIISIVLCFAMFLTLMPVYPALATSSTDVISREKYTPTSYASFSDLTSKVPDYSGHVIRMVDSDASDSLLTSGFVRLDIGSYNVPESSMLDFRIKYDTNKVSLASVQSGVVKEYVANAQKAGKESWLLIPRNYSDADIKTTDNTTIDALKKSYYFINGDVARTNTEVGDNFNTPTLLKFEDRSVIEVGVDNVTTPTTFTGNIGFTMTANNLTSTIASENWFNIIGSNDEFVTTGVSEPVYFASIYFKNVAGQTVSSDTFAMYKGLASSSQTGTAATINASTITTQNIVFVGFPQPAAETATVDITVNKSDTNITPLADAEVTFVGTTNGKRFPETGVYKTNSAGKLMDGTTSELVTLTLPADTYTWTVTPPASETTLATYSEDFVVSGTSITKTIRAKDFVAGDQTYAFKMLDGESSTDNPIYVKDAEVTLDGSKLTTKDSDGNFTVTRAPGTVSFSVDKAGYTKISGSVTLTNDGKISFDGKEVAAIPMAQTKTKVNLEIKKAGVAIPNAIVTLSKNSKGVVTGNMQNKVLPLTAKTTDGIASFDLPNGDYQYVINAPGYETIGPVTMMVRSGAISLGTSLDTAGAVSADTGIISGGSITAGGVGDIPGSDNTVTIPSDKITGDTNITPSPITDPYYSIEGVWNSDTNPTSMEVKVYLNNASATMGTFGLKYDTNIFNTVTAGNFTQDTTNLDTITPFSYANKTPANPDIGADYHAFIWQAKTKTVLDATTTKKLIGTYNLSVKAGLTADQVKAKINDHSLYVQPYDKTTAAGVIKEAIPNEEAYQAQIREYWQEASTESPLPADRLSPDKASYFGFHQIMKEQKEEDAVFASDIRSQFSFPSYGNVGASFEVIKGTQEDPLGYLSDATITIKKGTTVISTGTTDKNGFTSLTVPSNGTYIYEVTKTGYKKVEGTIDVLDKGVDTRVYVMPDHVIPVGLESESAKQVDLLGNSLAELGADYKFNLKPKAGYTWQNSNPAKGDMELNYINTDNPTETIPIDSSKLTWDSNSSKYVLGKADLPEYKEKYNIVIKVKSGLTQNSQYKVSVNAGKGGTFSYKPLTVADDGIKNISTFDPATPTEGCNSVVESLGTAEVNSAKYTFILDSYNNNNNNDPATNKDKYTGYVIKDFIVNGVPIGLSDPQRIHGVKNYQLLGIDSNQAITVTFTTAKIDGGGTESGDDDKITEELDPQTNPAVSLTVGSHGTAKIASEDVVGYTRKDYVLANDATTFNVKFIGEQNVVQPDTTTANYVADKIVVNGVAIEASSDNVTLTKAVHDVDGTWTLANGLSLTGLAKGDRVNIAATFKIDGQESSQAVLITQLTDGLGSAQPMGTSIYNVGDMPTLALSPLDSKWQLKELILQESGSSEAVDKTQDVDKTNSTYKVPALKSGTTTVSYAFKELGFTVDLLVNYAWGDTGITPYKGAVITCSRTSGGVSKDLVFDNTTEMPASSNVSYRMELPAGTWSIKVKKTGFLDYTITNVIIKEDGTSGNTSAAYSGTVDGKTVMFLGQTTADSVNRKKAKLTIGDATWDGKYITAADIGQVSNGLSAGDNQRRKIRADVDESILIANGQGDVDATTDMGYVKAGLGALYTVVTYDQFMAQ